MQTAYEIMQMIVPIYQLFCVAGAFYLIGRRVAFREARKDGFLAAFDAKRTLEPWAIAAIRDHCLDEHSPPILQRAAAKPSLDCLCGHTERSHSAPSGPCLVSNCGCRHMLTPGEAAAGGWQLCALCGQPLSNAAHMTGGSDPATHRFVVSYIK